MAKTFTYVCGACGTRHYIPRGLAVACPACDADVGEWCRDKRSGRSGKRRLTVHPEREALLP